MRDVISHQYDQIDLDTVWGEIQQEIPALLELIMPLLPEEPAEDIAMVANSSDSPLHVQSRIAALEQENNRLRKSEARYRQVVENAPISILLLNTKGYITEMNQAAVQLYGLSMKQLNQQACPIFENPQLVENGTLPYMQQALAGETVIERPTYYDASRNFEGGKLNYGKGHYCPIWNAAGEVEEIVEIAADFSDFFELQQQFLQAKEHAAQERARLLSTVAQVANLLLRSSDYTAVLPDVVRRLGEAVESDQCSITGDVIDSDSGKPSAVKFHTVWDAEGVTPAFDVMVESPMEDRESHEFHEMFLQGQTANFLVADKREPLQSIFASQGITSMLIVPIMVQAEQDRAELLKTVTTVANQLLRSTVLQAEEAKQAAITREREKAALSRAAELAKANEALKRSLTMLAHEPSLDKFLGYVLQTIADQLGDCSGAVYLYSEFHNTTLLHLNYENGHLQQGERITHPAATLPRPPQAWDDQYLPLLRHNQLLIHHATEFDSPAYAPYRQHNRERGIQTLLIVPMLFGDQLLGSLTLRSTQHRDYIPEELELARALAQQATLAIQLTQLAEQRRQTAVLEERNRIARDIHDTLAQSFTGIIMQLEATKSLPNSNCPDLHTSLECIGELARLGLSEARRSVRALRLEALETADFSTALQCLLHRTTNGTSIRATLAIEGTPRPLCPNLEENLLRIAQEALTNAIRHGHAHTIILQLLFEPTTVHLQITDDGSGFDPHSTSFSGFGLLGMQERTNQLNGQFHLVSQPEQGTAITVSVPI